MLLTALGVVLFAVVIMLSIALHEIGHLVPAKRYGVKVTQYMVGFGPTAWSRRRGETEYGIKWIPLGGYIRMIGMLPPGPGGDPTRLRRSSTGPFQALMADARAASLEEVRPGDENRVFYKLPARQKVVIMTGGPLMNLVLGLGLLAVAVSAIGAPVREGTTTVALVPECVVPSGVERTACLASDPASPAASAGLRPGDRIVQFDGVAVADWETLSTRIREAAPGAPVGLVVERGGERLALQTALIETQRRVSPGSQQLETVSYLGVAPTTVVVGRDRMPLAEFPLFAAQRLGDVLVALSAFPERLVGVWDAAFSGGERDPEGPVGVVGISRIGGEVVALEQVSSTDKLLIFVQLGAGLNLFLFVFNLIPLPPLDGGHVAGALYEGGRRHLSRLRRRPDPGPADVAKLLPVAYVIAPVLISVSLLLVYADVVNPIRIAQL